MRPGVTISDYLTGTFAAFAAVAALYGRDQEGRGGDVIDAPLYGSVLRVLEWTLAGYDKLGIVRQREGNRLSTSAPLDNYPTADGYFVCIVAGSDANFHRLCTAMDRRDLIDDPRFLTLAERASRSGEINGIVADWTSSLPAEEITARCVEHDVPVGTAYSAEDIFADPHMAARGDLVAVDDPVLGPVRQQAPFPRLAKARLPCRVARPAWASTTARCGVTSWASARTSWPTWEVAAWSERRRVATSGSRARRRAPDLGKRPAPPDAVAARTRRSLPPHDVPRGARLRSPLVQRRHPPVTMRPVDITVTGVGIVLGTYEPAGPAGHGQM